MDGEDLESSNEQEPKNAEEPGTVSQAETATNTELRRLGSTNPPGHQEEIASADGRRLRGSTVASVRTRYEVATQEFREALEELEEKHTLGRLPDRHSRKEYGEVVALEGRVIKAADELIKANTKVGATAHSAHIRGSSGHAIFFGYT